MMYLPGTIVKGKVTGIQPYGAFVQLDEHTSGLVHISEISADYVSNVNYYVKVGEILELKVLDTDTQNNQVRLSLKALRPARIKNNKHYLKNMLPNSVIGFKSLEAELPNWIKEKEGEIHDKN